MLFMGPLAAVAILALQQVHFVSPSPFWLIPVMLVVGQLASSAAGFWWDRSHTPVRLHARIGTQMVLVTAVIYITGWGPALAIGLVLVGQESLAMTGSSSYRVVLAWTFACLAAGQAAGPPLGPDSAAAAGRPRAGHPGGHRHRLLLPLPLLGPPGEGRWPPR